MNILSTFKHSKPHPSPSKQDIERLQRFWKFKFPDDYLNFINSYNGVKIEGGAVFLCESGFKFNKVVLERFLPILQDIDVPDGMYDIDVVMTQLDERLIANPDTDERTVIVPIAELFAGDFLCLDFSNTPATICVWDHEQSDDWSPHTYYVAKNFTEFLKMLSPIEKH